MVLSDYCWGEDLWNSFISKSNNVVDEVGLHTLLSILYIPSGPNNMLKWTEKGDTLYFTAGK